ncbi:MAG TPA: MarR family transcriptional regulator [Chthoniobacteraceae bacterium]|nr:MarR family transcriptional regulator [Chthoniobacteraceae bacterium]
MASHDSPSCAPVALADVVGKSVRLEIVLRLKRSEGLTVAQLAEHFGMSYMAIKQPCADLEARGYLERFRRPTVAGKSGRPGLLYRLSEATLALFPKETALSVDLLRSAESLFGATAPEKLLYLGFKRTEDEERERLAGRSFAARLKAWTAWRDARGYFAEYRPTPEGGEIIEYHSPILDILTRHPALIQRLEEQLFARVLQARVRRTMTRHGGHYRAVFTVGASLP